MLNILYETGEQFLRARKRLIGWSRDRKSVTRCLLYPVAIPNRCHNPKGGGTTSVCR